MEGADRARRSPWGAREALPTSGQSKAVPGTELAPVDAWGQRQRSFPVVIFLDTAVAREEMTGWCV